MLVIPPSRSVDFTWYVVTAVVARVVGENVVGDGLGLLLVEPEPPPVPLPPEGGLVGHGLGLIVTGLGVVGENVVGDGLGLLLVEPEPPPGPLPPEGGLVGRGLGLIVTVGDAGAGVGLVVGEGDGLIVELVPGPEAEPLPDPALAQVCTTSCSTASKRTQVLVRRVINVFDILEFHFCILNPEPIRDFSQ